MNTKHTRGPWYFYTEPQPNGCPIVGARGLMVAMLAHTVNQVEQKEEALANARLIAAAPELLAALENIAAATCSDSRSVIIARAAIAKATGEQA